MEPYEVTTENAVKIYEWMTSRNGILIWDSHDLGNPGQTWTTPAQ